MEKGLKDAGNGIDAIFVVIQWVVVRSSRLPTVLRHLA